MNGIIRFAPLAVLSGVTYAVGPGAQADTHKETVAACLEAVRSDDMDTAERLADEIVDWRALFATQLIADAKACLEAAKGGEWTYFTTKSRFLTGMEADMEQDYIDKAMNKKASNQIDYQNERARLECEITDAQESVKSLEAEYDNFKLARTQEAEQMTMKVCYDLYASDPAAALLEPVCNEAFLETGLPDSDYEFDFTNIMSAKVRLAKSKVELGELLRGVTGSDISMPFGSDCAKFSVED